MCMPKRPNVMSNLPFTRSTVLIDVQQTVTPHRPQLLGDMFHGLPTSCAPWPTNAFSMNHKGAIRTAKTGLTLANWLTSTGWILAGSVISRSVFLLPKQKVSGFVCRHHQHADPQQTSEVTSKPWQAALHLPVRNQIGRTWTFFNGLSAKHRSRVQTVLTACLGMICANAVTTSKTAWLLICWTCFR